MAEQSETLASNRIYAEPANFVPTGSRPYSFVFPPTDEEHETHVEYAECSGMGLFAITENEYDYAGVGGAKAVRLVHEDGTCGKTAVLHFRADNQNALHNIPQAVEHMRPTEWCTHVSLFSQVAIESAELSAVY